MLCQQGTIWNLAVPRKQLACDADGFYRGSMKSGYHMRGEAFRKWGHALIDWLVEYHGKVETLPVKSKVKPGQVRAGLPRRAPMRGEKFRAILRDVERVILPGVTHWQSPNFFAYFPGNSSGPAVLGELLSAGLSVQGMLWATSPACTELETHVLDWLVDMLGLPAQFKSSNTGGGVIQDTASSAVLCALLAAREQATHLETNEKGCNRKLTVYTSNQAHSSVEKAMKIAGFGRENLRLLEVGENFAMKPAALAVAIREDLRQGKRPCFVCATIGTTSSNAIDPVENIGKICARHKIWLHVDAAMAGTAAICPEFRWTHAGLGKANSYCFNPHKWMFTNFDCSCLYVADRSILIKALSVLPEYLKNQASESGAVIDYRDWQIELGRRFRSLKLWFVIRHYGIEGLRHHIREHVKLAQEFKGWLAKAKDFELMAPAPLNLVCFAHRNGDEFNRRLLDKLNDSGKMYVSHTLLNGRYTLRLCVGQTKTQRRHVKNAWKL